MYSCFCCSGAVGDFFAAATDVADAVEASAVRAVSGRDSVSRRTFVAGTAAIVAAGSSLPAIARAQARATTVFTGGTVLTVDTAFTEAAAIAIRGNTILAVGSDSEVRAAAGSDAVVVDLAGRTLLPGFIDPHTHVIAGSAIEGIADYVGMMRFQSADQILAHLAARAAATPAGEWIMARNFDPAIQQGPAALTFAELDAVSTRHPIVIMNASMHLAYANRKAFEVAGIPPDIANPPGAEFVRGPDGQLNGVMKNNIAFGRVVQKNPAFAGLDPMAALIDLLGKWGRLGLTTVSELSLGALSRQASEFGLLTAAARSGRLKARIRAYPFHTLGAAVWDAAGIVPGAGDALARIAGYKLIADGSNQGFTGLQRQPYLDSDSVGVAYVSAADLAAQAVERASKGWQIAIHGNGDAAIDNVLDACQAVRDAGVDMGRVRARIEHCSILHDEQIARMKALGVSASFLIGHVHYWGVAMRDEVFGPEKVQLLDRCKSVQDAGIRFTLHSDFTVTDPDPLHMIQMAVTRKTWKEPDYVLAPAERISVEAAIRAMTADAAWQLNSEHEVGSLEPGKLADFVILDKDPRKVDPDTIRHIAVLETWMDGNRVFKA